VSPGPEAVRSGTYPFHKDLGLVTRGAPAGLTEAFLSFVRSPEGRAIIEAQGYLPLGEDEP
jgi:phosphate transport system substrate-binding protein